MAAIVMFPGASLYVKSQLSLWPSIRKESKYLLPSQPLSQHFSSSLLIRQPIRYSQTVSCYPDQSSSPRTRLNLNPSTKLFVSGLSFRTTEESLRNAFNNFGELVEVNLMMDKIANRPRGFAFLIFAMLRRRNHIKQLRECMARKNQFMCIPDGAVSSLSSICFPTSFGVEDRCPMKIDS